MIPIEDDFNDILLKAMRGRGISDRILAEKSGVPIDIVNRLCRGEFCDESALPKLAAPLGLNGDALVVAASKSWYPKPTRVKGIEIFNTPYRDMAVNAFLVWDPESMIAAAFDTGTDSSLIVKKANSLGVTIESIFITHTHNDHIADLSALQNSIEGVVAIYSNADEPAPDSETFQEGALFNIGTLNVETRTTSGHSVGGTTYVINGLERPVAVVGDAMFAGSMGGGMVSFDDALRNNREKIMTLPDETLICPGHGPMTTVGEERRFNAFLKS